MIDPERRVGPWRLRVWGLILNFIANALAVYGALGVFVDGSRILLFGAGVVLTLLCLLVLAIPSRESKPDEDREDSG